MKSVMIYPFGKETEVIARHSDMLKDLELVCLAGLKGCGGGKNVFDAGCRRIPLVYGFEEGMETCEPEVIWFVSFRGYLDFEEEYLSYIKLAIESKKKLILDESIVKLAEKSINSISEYIYKPSDTEKKEPEYGDYLQPINTPVIYICSLYGSLCKFDLQLMLRRELQKRDISMVQVGTKKMSSRFGFWDLPWFMETDSITDKKKTLMFNQYLKELEEKDRPDAIVVGVPGEVCIPTNKYIGGFGYLARDYFVAVQPDIVIMLLPYGLYRQKELDNISETITSRLGAPVDIFCRTDKHLLTDDMETEQRWAYLTVNEKDKKENIPIKNLYDLEQEQMPRMAETIINRLKEYGRIDSV